MGGFFYLDCTLLLFGLSSKISTEGKSMSSSFEISWMLWTIALPSVCQIFHSCSKVDKHSLNSAFHTSKTREESSCAIACTF